MRYSDNPLQINTVHNPAKGWRPATETASASFADRESEREPSVYNNTHPGIIISDELCIQQKESVYIIIIITARAVTDAVLTTWRYFNTQSVYAGTKLSVQLFPSWAAAASDSLTLACVHSGCAR
jgi:hypothetical protein